MLSKRKTVGDYTIGKTIGQGAFSKVKIGYNKITKEEVAIKIINKKQLEVKNKKTKENKEIYRKRLQLMMRLDHPNIIKIYQVIESEEETLIVMEYAPGGELIDYILTKKHLNETEARKFFRQIISAIDHCHMANVVHRDLKLENLLLSKEKNILITDFGLGRTFDGSTKDYMTTFCGTPNYAAVELISGIPYIGVKSDIWALGVILYVMMTGKPPFDGRSINALYRRIKRIDYKVPSYFSKDLANLLAKIFVRDPEQRASINDLRDDPWVNYEEVE
ncbi:Pkinase-domain-containing protein, partial [Neocallimastix californiae]